MKAATMTTENRQDVPEIEFSDAHASRLQLRADGWTLTQAGAERPRTQRVALPQALRLLADRNEQQTDWCSGEGGIEQMLRAAAAEGDLLRHLIEWLHGPESSLPDALVERITAIRPGFLAD